MPAIISRFRRFLRAEWWRKIRRPAEGVLHTKIEVHELEKVDSKGMDSFAAAILAVIQTNLSSRTLAFATFAAVVFTLQLHHSRSIWHHKNTHSHSVIILRPFCTSCALLPPDRLLRQALVAVIRGDSSLVQRRSRKVYQNGSHGRLSRNWYHLSTIGAAHGCRGGYTSQYVLQGGCKAAMTRLIPGTRLSGGGQQSTTYSANASTLQHRLSRRC